MMNDCVKKNVLLTVLIGYHENRTKGKGTRTKCEGSEVRRMEIIVFSKDSGTIQSWSRQGALALC